MNLVLQRDAAQRSSDAAALVATAVLVAVLLSAPLRWRSAPELQAQGQPLQLTLADPAPGPVDSTPPKPVPPPPRHHEVARAPAITAPIPAPVDPLPLPSEEVPADAAIVAAGPPAPPSAAGGLHGNADLEAEYAAALRAEIEQRAHDPMINKARAMRAIGEVQVRFMLSRNGSPSAVAVMRSSGSGALDRAALEVVASGRYAAMPAAIFKDESAHLFAVTIEFGPDRTARQTR
jgi:protein TonB